MMPEPTSTRCDELLPADAPRGLCPACLLPAGLAGDSSEADGPSDVTTSHAWSGPGPEAGGITTSLRGTGTGVDPGETTPAEPIAEMPGDPAGPRLAPSATSATTRPSPCSAAAAWTSSTEPAR
jgi:hypothetical protein